MTARPLQPDDGSSATAAAPSAAPARATPFRFYDNRQKYLAFVNTCNEKAVIAARCAEELARARPTPPALALFDAGMGDGTVLARVLRAAHDRFPTVPVLAVAKEISLEDVRLGLEKLPDRFVEHPHTVLVVTNLSYADAPSLLPSDPQRATQLGWHEVALEGASAYELGEHIEALGPVLAAGWGTSPSPETGNPLPLQPSVLVLYRRDREFLLHDVIARLRRHETAYDFVLASQPWRARMDAAFKVEKILAPLTRSLAPGGRLLAVQSWGRDPAAEIVERLWPGEMPFTVDRHVLLDTLRSALGDDAAGYELTDPSDEEAVFRYEMHTLPSEIGDRIGTSTLFAAWNAVVYVNQIEDERLEEALRDGRYLDVTHEVLRKHGVLWFNDEAFVVERRRDGVAAAGASPAST
jgi:CheY-like chemotaxis protein